MITNRFGCFNWFLSIGMMVKSKMRLCIEQRLLPGSKLISEIDNAMIETTNSARALLIV